MLSFRTFAIVAMGLALIGCQVQPLYRAAPELQLSQAGQIAIPELKTREGQQVRNHLIFLFNGGARPPETAPYTLQLSVTRVATSILSEPSREAPTAGIMKMTGRWTLSPTDGKAPIGSGERSVAVPYDLPEQEFAELRSIRDAENRAAEELARFVYADVGIFLAKQ